MRGDHLEDIVLGATEITSDQVVRIALSLVSSAAHEILATMDLKEEISNPLPAEYFSLLQKKTAENVNLTRLAFGTDSDFHIFMTSLKKLPGNYRCIHANSSDYRRMLLIDRAQMLFALETPDGRKYYFTNVGPCISVFTQYFREQLSLIPPGSRAFSL